MKCMKRTPSFCKAAHTLGRSSYRAFCHHRRRIRRDAGTGHQVPKRKKKRERVERGEKAREKNVWVHQCVPALMCPHDPERPTLEQHSAYYNFQLLGARVSPSHYCFLTHNSCTCFYTACQPSCRDHRKSLHHDGTPLFASFQLYVR